MRHGLSADGAAAGNRGHAPASARGCQRCRGAQALGAARTISRSGATLRCKQQTGADPVIGVPCSRIDIVPVPDVTAARPDTC